MKKNQPTNLSTTPDEKRRHLLKVLGGGGLILGSPLLLTACNSSDSNNTTINTSGCALIPTETEGPYPLKSVLSNAAMIRHNIIENRTGAPLTVILKLVNINASCAPVTNASVYLWHCDKDGNYSGYTTEVGKTYLRGIWSADADGQVEFQTIYPGWYTGRITHIHFQVYLNGSTTTATATSQIAFPPATTTAVYNSSAYAARGQNTSVTSFAQDNIFSDGTTYQLATITGNITDGLTATLTVGISI